MHPRESSFSLSPPPVPSLPPRVVLASIPDASRQSTHFGIFGRISRGWSHSCFFYVQTLKYETLLLQGELLVSRSKTGTQGAQCSEILWYESRGLLPLEGLDSIILRVPISTKKAKRKKGDRVDTSFKATRTQASTSIIQERGDKQKNKQTRVKQKLTGRKCRRAPKTSGWPWDGAPSSLPRAWTCRPPRRLQPRGRNR